MAPATESSNDKIINILGEHDLTQVHRGPTFSAKTPILIKHSDSIPGLFNHECILTDSKY